MIKAADSSIHYINKETPVSVQICKVSLSWKDKGYVFENIVSGKRQVYKKSEIPHIIQYINLTDTIPDTAIIISHLAAFDANKVLETTIVPSNATIRAAYTQLVKDSVTGQIQYELRENLSNKSLFIENLTTLPLRKGETIETFYKETTRRILVCGHFRPVYELFVLNEEGNNLLVYADDYESDVTDDIIMNEAYFIPQKTCRLYNHLRILTQYCVNNLFANKGDNISENTGDNNDKDKN